MTFTQAVEIIRERTAADIVSIVGETVKLKGTRGQFQGLCPFHDEKTPSFQVSESKQIFKCFGCGEGGDAIEFVMKSRGLDFPETIRHLARRYHLTIDDKSDDSYRQKLAAEEDIIPGITEIKGQIRKAGKVYAALGSDAYQEQVEAPKLLITPPISKEEAKVLWKYADQVVLIPGNETRWPELRDSLKGLLPFFDFMPKKGTRDLRIFSQYVTETVEEDWLKYIVPEIGGMVQRKEVSQLLALIPDNLYRDIYTTEFAKLLSKNSNPASRNQLKKL